MFDAMLLGLTYQHQVARASLPNREGLHIQHVVCPTSRVASYYCTVSLVGNHMDTLIDE